jgi:hypothetical protein
MKKMFVVFGMIVFIYLTMSIFAGNWNPVLWISGSGKRVLWLSYAFFVEIVFFCMTCFVLYTDE